eukprot:scaffold34590_cov37-Attheya_sp.AAC.2
MSATPIVTPQSSSGSLMGAVSAPSSALHQLLQPDGYYTYLGIPKQSVNILKSASAAEKNVMDEDLVKKNYRKLSLKHHPDRRGGDADTFRVLNRAKRVLLHTKLRQEYDLLGLDLDDDDDDDDQTNVDNNGDNNGDNPSSSSPNKDASSGSSSAESVMSHMASATLAAILQTIVRTGMVAVVVTILCRWKWTMIPSCLFMLFVTAKVALSSRQTANRAAGASYMDALQPFLMGMAVWLMYYGRSSSSSSSSSSTWSVTFWAGEGLVTFYVMKSSLPVPPNGATAKNVVLVSGACGVVAGVATLLLRGRFWRYTCLICGQAALALLCVLVFPVLEMILEEIMREKLHKIGDKIRAHSKRMEQLQQLQQQQLHHQQQNSIHNTVKTETSPTSGNTKKQ